MIKITLGKALSETVDTTNHYLYVYRDNETIFYVGRSTSPIDRLLQHLGKENPWYADRLGDVIKNNLPESLEWVLELYTLNECEQYMMGSPIFDFYMENRDNLLHRDLLISDVEERMIHALKPCLNIQGNRRNATKLPDKYRKKESPIANEGVKLG